MRTPGISKKETVLLVLLVITFFMLQSPIVWKSMYPISYREEVKLAADRYGLDPYLILAVIQIESNFDHDRISRKGAVGLMQLMPETAAWVIEQGNFPPDTMEFLSYPEVNVHLGSWYLSFLDKTFNGNQTAVIAAYNAGQGNVIRWLEEGRWDGRLETVSQIPYGETRHYIQRVMYYYGRYLDIYEDDF